MTSTAMIGAETCGAKSDSPMHAAAASVGRADWERIGIRRPVILWKFRALATKTTSSDTTVALAAPGAPWVGISTRLRPALSNRPKIEMRRIPYILLMATRVVPIARAGKVNRKVTLRR